MLSNLWGREPAMILSLVSAVIALLLSFGVHLTTDQIGAIMAVVAVVLGLITRSQVSPTSGLTQKSDVKVSDATRAKLVLLILVLSGLPFLNACAHPTPRHVLVTVDSSLYEVISDIHATEQKALCGQPSCAGVPDAPTVPGWDSTKSKTFNTDLLPAAKAGQNLNRVLAAWQPGQPVPDEVQSLVKSIGDALKDVTSSFPDGTTKTALLTAIGNAQQIALTTLTSVLLVVNAAAGK